MRIGSGSGTDASRVAPVLSRFRDDEGGFTTVGIAVALVLSLSLVFAAAGGGWVLVR